MALNLSKWHKEFIRTAQFGSELIEMSYYSPKRMYDNNLKIYYMYIQPVILLLLWIWLIILLRVLWTDDFQKKYGFMTGYTSIELTSLTLANIVFIYGFTMEENYMEFNMCYVFELCTTTVPVVCYSLSQWLKVGQAFQKFIILYKPMQFKKFINRWTVGTFVVLDIILCCSLGTKNFLLIDFEKVVKIDKSTLTVVEICREPGFFEPEKQKEEINNFSALDIVELMFKQTMPLIFMISLSIATVRILRKQMKFRQKFNSSRTEREIALGRLVKVTVTSTVFYVLITTAAMAITITAVFSKCTMDDKTHFKMFEYSALINQVLFVCNIPVTCFMFSWLSWSFRNAIIKILTKCRRQNTTSQHY